MRRRLAALLTLAAVVPATASADPGERDRGFGAGDGHVDIRIAASAGPVLLDDRIVLASARGSRLLALTPGGRLDRRFGSGGVVRLAGRVREMEDVVRHGDGLLVAGALESGYTLTRLHADGRIDEQFGTGGTATAIGPWHGTGDVAAAADGTIYASTSSTPPWTPDFASHVLRHHPSGAVDESFGTRGVASFGEGASVNTLFPTPHGLVVTGSTPAGSGFLRLTRDGAVDPAFPPVLWGRGLIGVGASAAGDVGWATVWPHLRSAGRIRADGTRDPRFPVPRRGELSTYSRRHVVGVEATGHLVHPIVEVGASEQALVARLTPDGRRDRAFGIVRFRRARFGFGSVVGIAVDRAGRIVVLAQRYDGLDIREDISGASRIVASVRRIEGGVPLVRIRSARRVRGAVDVVVACLARARAACTGTVAVTDRAGRVVGRRAVRLAAGAPPQRVRVRRRRAARGVLVATARIFDVGGILSTDRRGVRRP